MSNFIDLHEFKNPAVFWLDFTNLTKPYLDTLANLVFKLPLGSIIKITFNAGPPYNPSEDNQSKAVFDFRKKYKNFRDLGNLPAASLLN